MSVESAVFSLISTNLEVRLIAGGRVFPIVLPQNIKFPAIHFSRISAPRTYALDGTKGVVPVRFEVESYSKVSAEEAKALSEAVRHALEGFKGTVAGVKIQRIFLEGDDTINRYAPRTDVFRYVQDFVVHHIEK